MPPRSALPALALFGALLLASSPALACERHKNHHAAVAEAVPAAPQPQATEGVKTIEISPAAAAMSVSEALGSEPAAMRCPRMRKLEQALTQ